MNLPGLINFNEIGNPAEGFLSVASNIRGLPFEIKRVFWTYDTPENISRGRHAHFATEMVLIAVKGTIKVNCRDSRSFNRDFILARPNVGLYIPPLFWHTMEYTKDAVQLVLTNTDYDEKDYIRDYKKFMEMNKS